MVGISSHEVFSGGFGKQLAAGLSNGRLAASSLVPGLWIPGWCKLSVLVFFLPEAKSQGSHELVGYSLLERLGWTSLEDEHGRTSLQPPNRPPTQERACPFPLTRTFTP